MSASASGNGIEDEEATGGPLITVSKKLSQLFAPSYGRYVEQPSFSEIARDRDLRRCKEYGGCLSIQPIAFESPCGVREWCTSVTCENNNSRGKVGLYEKSACSFVAQ